MTNCEHMNFNCHVAVNRLEDTKSFHADVTITCAECNLPFQFLGLPGGLIMDGAAVSVDGTEARLAIRPMIEGTHSVSGLTGKIRFIGSEKKEKR